MTQSYNVPMDLPYLANLLGAVSLAVTDTIADDAEATVESGGQAAGALVLLGLRPRTSIKRLAERLRLTHAGAVRLVARLEQRGWVVRHEDQDGRVVRLSLSPAGQARLDMLRARRIASLEGLIAPLDEGERAALQTALEKLAAGLTRDPVAAYANCRLCDTALCEAHGCPIEAAAREKFGLPPTTYSEER